jgi:hypothetical protein
MNQRVLTAVVRGAALIAATGIWIAVSESTKGPVFIPGGKPVTEEQVRHKMEADGYLNIQIVRQGHTFAAIGAKDGKVGKVVVHAQTGRLANGDDDDD